MTLMKPVAYWNECMPALFVFYVLLITGFKIDSYNQAFESIEYLYHMVCIPDILPINENRIGKRGLCHLTYNYIFPK